MQGQRVANHRLIQSADIQIFSAATNVQTRLQSEQASQAKFTE